MQIFKLMKQKFLKDKKRFDLLSTNLDHLLTPFVEKFSHLALLAILLKIKKS